LIKKKKQKNKIKATKLKENDSGKKKKTDMGEIISLEETIFGQ